MGSVRFTIVIRKNTVLESYSVQVSNCLIDRAYLDSQRFPPPTWVPGGFSGSGFPSSVGFPLSSSRRTYWFGESHTSSLVRSRTRSFDLRVDYPQLPDRTHRLLIHRVTGPSRFRPYSPTKLIRVRTAPGDPHQLTLIDDQVDS